MRSVAILTVCLLFLSLSGCGDACVTLAEESCARHGEDSAVCIARSNPAAESAPDRQAACRRALMLYRSFDGSERSE
ncbi:MAG: hypothetical protein FJ109_15040 [Deltaproteobacteria bacterium]|nr:hypothetical protein [Deltaproteobacteria bacterium]